MENQLGRNVGSKGTVGYSKQTWIWNCKQKTAESTFSVCPALLLQWSVRPRV